MQATSRIRLDEHKARFLYWLLADERLRLLDERRYAKAAGVQLTSYQQMTSLIRDIRDQLEVSADEMGWDLGVPEYENT
jgi:hypothetical protein